VGALSCLYFFGEKMNGLNFIIKNALLLSMMLLAACGSEETYNIVDDGYMLELPNATAVSATIAQSDYAYDVFIKNISFSNAIATLRRNNQIGDILLITFSNTLGATHQSPGNNSLQMVINLDTPLDTSIGIISNSNMVDAYLSPGFVTPPPPVNRAEAIYKDELGNVLAVNSSLFTISALSVDESVTPAVYIFNATFTAVAANNAVAGNNYIFRGTFNVSGTE